MAATLSRIFSNCLELVSETLPPSYRGREKLKEQKVLKNYYFSIILAFITCDVNDYVFYLLGCEGEQKQEKHIGGRLENELQERLLCQLSHT